MKRAGVTRGDGEGAKARPLAESPRHGLAPLMLGVAMTAGLTVGSPAVVARPKPASRALVMLATPGQAAAAKRVAHALRAQLSETSVALRVVWINRYPTGRQAQLRVARSNAQSQRVLAVFWGDLLRRDQILLWVTQPGRLVTRTLTHTAKAGRLESLAIIVRSALATVLERYRLPSARRAADPRRVPPRPAMVPRRIAPRRPFEPRRVAPKRPAEPRRTVAPKRAVDPGRAAALRKSWLGQHPRWLSISAAFGITSQATRSAAVPAGLVGLVLHLPQRFSLRLSYRPERPLTPSLDGVTVALTKHPIALGVGWRWRWGRFELGAALDLELTLVQANVTSQRTDVTLRQPSLHLVASALPRAQAAVLIAPRLRAFLDVGGRLLFNRPAYALQTGAGPEIVYRPWQAQPFVLLGFTLGIY